MRKLVLKIIVFFSIFFVSCEKDSIWADKEDYEKKKIKEYLENMDYNVTPTESGLYYIETEQGDGDSPVVGDFVTFEYTLQLLDGTIIGTSDSAYAAEKSIYDSTLLYGPDKRQIGRLIQGVNEAFTYMKENGKAKVIVPFSLGYGDYSLDDIPPYSTLIFDLVLLEVIEDPEVHEQNIMDTFLIKRDDFVKIDDGLYYKKLKEGNEDKKIGSISIIDFSYSMYLIDGRHVSTKNTVESIQSISIIGLRQGFQLMTEKEKGVFIIRSDLAYGANENLSIPPYSTLMIEVEINEIN